MADGPAMDLRAVRVTYRTKGESIPALAGVDLEARHGEFVSIVGPSGCGKSTLLKVIAGLLPPSGGTVRVNGLPVERPTGQAGIVFQNPVLLAWRSILANVLLQIEVRRLPRPAYERRARELLALVGLKGFEDKYPHQLSGGMQQRAALCRALIHEPALLLMDEPFGALDALTREQMNLELQRVWLEHRKTVLFITHSIPEAVFLSDRVLVFTQRPGRVKASFGVGLARPRGMETMEEAAFVGLVSRIRRELQVGPAL